MITTVQDYFWRFHNFNICNSEYFSSLLSIPYAYPRSCVSVFAVECEGVCTNVNECTWVHMCALRAQCVYAYVSVCARMFICVHACIRVYMRGRALACANFCSNMHAYARACGVCVWPHMQSVCACVCVRWLLARKGHYSMLWWEKKLNFRRKRNVRNKIKSKTVSN